MDIKTCVCGYTEKNTKYLLYLLRECEIEMECVCGKESPEAVYVIFIRKQYVYFGFKSYIIESHSNRNRNPLNVETMKNLKIETLSHSIPKVFHKTKM